mgnify:CR=1 FL=1
MAGFACHLKWVQLYVGPCAHLLILYLGECYYLLLRLLSMEWPVKWGMRFLHEQGKAGEKLDKQDSKARYYNKCRKTIFICFAAFVYTQ